MPFRIIGFCLSGDEREDAWDQAMGSLFHEGPVFLPPERPMLLWHLHGESTESQVLVAFQAPTRLDQG